MGCFKKFSNGGVAMMMMMMDKDQEIFVNTGTIVAFLVKEKAHAPKTLLNPSILISTNLYLTKDFGPDSKFFLVYGL